MCCEFDDGLPSGSGDCCFKFTHSCTCGYHKYVYHLIGHDQEIPGDWNCDFCGRDWLETSSQIDAGRHGSSISEPVDDLYHNRHAPSEVNSTVVAINAEIIRYFAAHPEKIYGLSPRRFEELVADILKDFGFDVKLSPETRDGGKDIYAYIRNQVCSMLMFVECKKYLPDHHVGIDAVQRLYGVQQSQSANKSMIVTTSFFTRPAIEEARGYKSLMSLRDYNDLKSWLAKYIEP